MTNEEVIKFLKFQRGYYCDLKGSEEIQAYNMAIKALEQQTCDDSISRQAVLDALNNHTYSEEFCVEHHIDWSVNLGTAHIVINDLPSVTPQPIGWIPVIERLPEDGRPVLIYAWNVHYVIARYDSFRTENGYKKTWVTADACNGNTEIRHEVIAWMPLPEPYKEAENEDRD